MTNLVEMRGLGKTYDGAPAVEDGTLSIAPGDRIALLGRSGSGKSTLLNIIAGLDQPSSGQITWPGLEGNAPLLPTKIGLMFQTRSLIPWLDVVENVHLPLEIAGRGGDADTRAFVLLALFGVAGLADKLPDELSGGQAQRVALARAMVTTPPLLLADEPTGQLDHETASDVIGKLKAWADRLDIALVIATHDLAMAKLMDKVWTIDHGHVVEIAR
ncbi:MAG: ABC transporter ATP-binding protein [Devosia sp.]